MQKAVSGIFSIINGVYGEEWKRTWNENPGAAFNANTVVFKCENCGFWKESTDLTLYAPDDEANVMPDKEQLIPDFLLPELGRIEKEDTEVLSDATSCLQISYITPRELSRSYHVLKKDIHVCNKCGSVMNKLSEEEMRVLSCPVCGVPNEVNQRFYWD